MDQNTALTKLPVQAGAAEGKSKRAQVAPAPAVNTATPARSPLDVIDERRYAEVTDGAPVPADLMPALVPAVSRAFKPRASASEATTVNLILPSRPSRRC